MHGKNRLIGIRDAFAQAQNGLAELVRQAIADGIRDVQRGGAGIDHGFQNSAEKILFRTAGIFR